MRDAMGGAMAKNRERKMKDEEKPSTNPANRWRGLAERLVAAYLSKESDLPIVASDPDDDGVIRAGDVKPGEAPRVYLTRYGVVVNDEHGVTMHRNDGSVSTLGVDGSNEIRNPVVKRIEIDDALLIKDYRIAGAFGGQSHVIEFVGGGVFAYLRDSQGKVVEISLSNGAFYRSDWEGNMRVFASDPNAPSVAQARHA